VAYENFEETNKKRNSELKSFLDTVSNTQNALLGELKNHQLNAIKNANGVLQGI